MKPIIQIINAPYDASSNNATTNNSNTTEREELPFDISDPDDGLRAKFLEGLHYDSVSAGKRAREREMYNVTISVVNIVFTCVTLGGGHGMCTICFI